MKRIGAALAVAWLCASGATALPASMPDQALIDGATIPTKLSAFGFFQLGTSKLDDAVLPYTLQTPLFSDYADKHRGVWTPVGQKAQVGQDGAIDFPVGSVLIKSFGWVGRNDAEPVETRLLIHRASGWIGLPYIWDADGKDASLALAGRRIPVKFSAPDGVTYSIDYAVPNKNQCKECHNRAGVVLPIGPKLRNFTPDPAASPQKLARFFANPVALKPTLPRWDDPSTGTVAERARAYLDVNCSHCHNPEGSASNSGLFVRWTDPMGTNYGINKRPTAAGRGSGDRNFAIAPGEPERSFLIYRLESLDPGIAMPELGRSTVHKQGVALLRQWIAEMPQDGQRGGS